MKKLILILAGLGLFLFNSQVTEAQIETRGVYERETIANRKPVPLPHLREADIAWSKTIWRMIDLREKMNHPLYYPTEPMGSRMSLIDVLMHHIEEGNLTVYDDGDFRQELDIEEIQHRFDAETRIEMVEDVDTGEMIETEVPGTVRSSEVKQYLLVEQWYFDRRHSRFQVRVIGFCPIRVYTREIEEAEIDQLDFDDMETLRRQLFWVYYPEARDMLARYEVYTPFNDIASLSFDDLFVQRRFASYIYQESNVYDNRAISDYAVGQEIQYESERIKELLFNWEQDLWEY